MISAISSLYTASSPVESALMSREPRSRAAVERAAAPSLPKTLDVLELSDGTRATRETVAAETVATEKAATENVEVAEGRKKRELTEEDHEFRKVMHKFVGEVLFGQMLKSVRASQEPDPFLGRSNAQEIFQSQLDMIYVENMTNSSSNSLSDAMFNQMQRIMKKAEV